ncbi:MAG TPA: hypothetical protein IAA20_06765 [Candidatus Enterococcus avicola]|uniref:Uncharacterized protein n=1 Tax=Candidatus Enterococcus avicola TaxID=2838561 RepID=A0A9D2JIS4_9ENTE|nr:hypothetical protein [Candidatus Enterococcus avicola]
MEIAISDLQFSQLFLSEDKIKRVENWLTSETFKEAPVTIRWFPWSETPVLLDGHTRVFVASQKGITRVPVLWDDTELEAELEQLYQACAAWCNDQGIHSVSDFSTRILSQAQYEIDWIGRCQSYLAKLA